MECYLLELIDIVGDGWSGNEIEVLEDGLSTRTQQLIFLSMRMRVSGKNTAFSQEHPPSNLSSTPAYFPQTYLSICTMTTALAEN